MNLRIEEESFKIQGVTGYLYVLYINDDRSEEYISGYRRSPRYLIMNIFANTILNCCDDFDSWK